MEKGQNVAGYVILLIIFLIAAFGFWYFIPKEKNFSDQESCNSECIKMKYTSGDCKWESEMKTIDEKIKLENCLIQNSKHCGNKGACSCYCSNLIGGCAGVASEYTQECCDNWAEDNNILKIQCAGNWTIEDNKCKWVCS